MPTGTGHGVVDAFKSELFLNFLSCSRTTTISSSTMSAHSDDRTRFPILHEFLDLIRHGKHHNHVKQDNPPAAERESRFSSSSTRAQHQQQQQQPQQQQALPVNAQNTHAGQLPIPQPREAAEQIVLEEKEAKAKMPTYKGLEQFKLLDKMGEYALSQSSTSIRLM